MDTQERVTSLVLNSGGSPEIVAGILAIFAEERAADRVEAIALLRSLAPNVELLPTVSGIITQISNAVAGMRQDKKQAEAREAALVAALEKIEHNGCTEDAHAARAALATTPATPSRERELREALAPFAAEADRRPWIDSNLDGAIGGSALTNRDLFNARRALGPATGEAT